MPQTVWEHIERIRGKVDRARRSEAGLRRVKRAMRRPDWAGTGSGYEPYYDDVEALWDDGQIVWAHVVQANVGLFEDGKQDLPAALVYSQSPKFDRRISALAEVAQALFDLKGYEYEDAKVDAFARIITSETEFGYNLPVPRAIVGAESFVYNSIVIHRRMLPVPRLALSWFPIFVHPVRSRGTLLVPSTFWPPLLRRLWEAKWK